MSCNNICESATAINPKLPIFIICAEVFSH
jgi:hypothetical protein